ncbi:MAG: hypothetical protein C0412_13880, partial [Flavobacterium sp.]|nr:hypothetical protein [Flavobacterium sp.]
MENEKMKNNESKRTKRVNNNHLRHHHVDMNDAVSAKENDWVKACIDAANDDVFFHTFRSSPAFLRVVEGSPVISGIWNLNRLLKNSIFAKVLPLVKTSDSVGFPSKIIYFKSVQKRNIISNKEWLSTTTIRYVNNCLNCLSLFGNKILNGNTEIYEIGAGYGGECKIFNDFAMSLYNKSIEESWHIFDLPSSTGLIERFLKQFKYSASFSRLGKRMNINNKDTLVISNGAFSEMSGDLLDSYFDSVISKAKHGYFITNFETHSVPHGGWTTEQFIDKLHSC